MDEGAAMTTARTSRGHTLKRSALTIGIAALVAGCSSDASGGADAAALPDSGAGESDSGTTDAGAAHVTESVVVTVDLSSSAGSVRDLFGVNKKPTAYDAKDTNNSYDVSAAYRAFGISQVRLHGDDGIDLCAIYKDAKIEDYASGSPVVVSTCTADTSGGPPHLKWTVKDPSKVNDVANYRFTELDAALASLVGSGVAPYVRLGHFYNGVNDVGDTASWAKVAVNIYKHIIGTFAPSATKLSPAHVEVFNEPDGMFWVGAKADFYALFNATVDGVRAAATAAGNTVSVGGPGFTAQYLTKLKSSTSTANGFVGAVTAARLDFFSVHSYDDCATATLANGELFLKNVRAEINTQGLSSTPMHISEWNIGLGKACGEAFYATAQVQSYASGMLSLMQDPQYNIEAAHFFAGVQPMSLFAVDKTNVGKVMVRPVAWSLWAHSKLRAGSRYAAQVCASEKCESSTTAGGAVVALAGSASGKRYAIVANDKDVSISITLRVTKGVSSGKFTIFTPPSTEQTVAATKLGAASYIVDDATMAALIATVAPVIQEGVVANGGLETNVSLFARGIALVELP